MSGKEKGERLAIVLTSENGDKLLRIPMIEDGTGESVAEAVFNALNQCKIYDLVEMICFDTTAVNTGSKRGAATLLEQKLGRDLLFFPCRHHISELMIRAVFELYFGKTTAPTVSEFDEFSRQWARIDSTEFDSGLDDDIIASVLSVEECEYVISFCQETLQNKQPRRDYKELLELTIVFLGGSVPNFEFRSPGPNSHARWMSKCIYSFKTFLVRKQLSLEQEKLDGFRNTCLFLVRVYVPYWFRCSKSVEAPNQDLNLIKKIVQYPDSCVSEVLLSKFRKHVWYLSEEPAVFSFFDPHVPHDMKRKMLANLDIENEDYAQCTMRNEITEVEFTSFAKMELCDFITPSSKQLFDRLQIETGFLKFDPSAWNERPDFLAAEKICLNVQVVNDAAERAVKIITKYNRTLTFDEEDKQYVLQVAEDYAKNYPSYRKSDLLN